MEMQRWQRRGERDARRTPQRKGSRREGQVHGREGGLRTCAPQGPRLRAEAGVRARRRARRQQDVSTRARRAPPPTAGCPGGEMGRMPPPLARGGAQTTPPSPGHAGCGRGRRKRSHGRRDEAAQGGCGGYTRGHGLTHTIKRRPAPHMRLNAHIRRKIVHQNRPRPGRWPAQPRRDGWRGRRGSIAGRGTRGQAVRAPPPPLLHSRVKGARPAGWLWGWPRPRLRLPPPKGVFQGCRKMLQQIRL